MKDMYSYRSNNDSLLNALCLLRNTIYKKKQTIRKNKLNEIQLERYPIVRNGLTLKEHAIKTRMREEQELDSLRARHSQLCILLNIPSSSLTSWLAQSKQYEQLLSNR